VAERRSQRKASKPPVRKTSKTAKTPKTLASGKSGPAKRRDAGDSPAAVAATRASDAPDTRPDLVLDGDAPQFGNIPWGYGDDRVTAMARDPRWLFAYWEVTDDAIARARAEVQDPDGWCVLRVYDTTFREFDGTNANWYVDVDVQREANNYYVPVDRPGATMHVDIGVKSSEGWFAKIARSSAVEMPRDSISSDTRTDWMTVWPDAAPPATYVHRFVPREAGAPPLEIDTQPAADEEIRGVMQSLVGEGWSRTEWTETAMDGRVVRWIRWIGPLWSDRWRGIPLRRETTVEVVFHGDRTVIRTEWGERVVIGPWIVTIYGATLEGRRVIDRWAVHYSWITEHGRVRVETAPILGRTLGWSWEAAAQAGSEARLAAGAGASEWLMRGASEWHWLGGSEQRLGGASERLFLGASEARYLGGSETLGASERLFLGASGFLGASEALAVGALLGGSEGLASGGLGGSERVRERLDDVPPVERR